MRLGSIRYINSLPVDLGLLSGQVSIDAEIIQSTPADLNEKMLSGDLDLGPLSVYFYAQHPSQFYLLPDISISSESGVQSVLLFSRKPLKDLAGERIAVTGEGRSTPALLEVLCRRFYGFTPSMVPLGQKFEGIAQGTAAALVIGDEALLARERMRGDLGISVYDLAEEWKRWTGLPFVFAVWAVRRDFFRRHSAEVRKAHEALLKSKRWGQIHSDEVLAEAKRRLDLSTETLRSYFSCLSYEFGPFLSEGMARYLEEVSSLAMIAPQRPPEFIGEAVESGTRRPIGMAGF